MWTSILLAAVGLTAMGIGYGLTLREANEFLDGQLRQVALNAGADPAPQPAPPAADVDPEDVVAVTVWFDGEVTRNDLEGAAMVRPRRAGYDEVVSHGHRWRTYATIAGPRTVLAAQRESVRREYAGGAAFGAAVPILLVIPLSWLVVGWALNRALARLDALAGELAQRSVAAAAEPMPLAGVPEEIVPLVAGMNGLVARLRTALDGQKQFIADAAHELRTPLAAIQVQLDNLASASPDEVPTRCGAIAGGVRRAAALVSKLLRLAQLDELAPASDEWIDLGPMVLDCVAAQLPLAAHKGIDLGARIEASARFRGAEAELLSLFEALVENAVGHTPPGGAVDVLLSRGAGSTVVEVLDDGPGLPPGAEARVFDRFYRAAPAGIEGTGLGLAIARRVADRHGLGLSVANRTDAARGVRAVVRLPA